MILKEADDRQSDLAQLRKLLEHPHADGATKKKIEQEIKNIQAGAKAESEVAYDLKVHLGQSQNWIAIHDLRVEVDDVVAQIDHLLINRFMEIYVCESKNFAEGVAINDHGEFTAFYAGKPRGVASPLEQNQRHLAVLSRLFRSGAVALPKRLGMTLSPTLKSLVLVSKNARIARPKKAIEGLECVIKTDQLVQRILSPEPEGLGSLASLAKVVSSETLLDLGRQLAALHAPLRFNWPGKFGLAVGLAPKNDRPAASALDPTSAKAPAHAAAPLNEEPAAEKPAAEKSKLACASCSDPVPYNVARFCWMNKARFDGKVLCRTCQQK